MRFYVSQQRINVPLLLFYVSWQRNAGKLMRFVNPQQGIATPGKFRTNDQMRLLAYCTLPINTRRCSRCLIASAELRNQFNGLKDLIDAIPTAPPLSAVLVAGTDAGGANIINVGSNGFGGSLAVGDVGISGSLGLRTSSGTLRLTAAGGGSTVIIENGSGAGQVIIQPSYVQMMNGTFQATASHVGFFGSTGAVQQGPVADASGGSTVDDEARAAINSALAALRAYGLLAP